MFAADKGHHRSKDTSVVLRTRLVRIRGIAAGGVYEDAADACTRPRARACRTHSAGEAEPIGTDGYGTASALTGINDSGAISGYYRAVGAI